MYTGRKERKERKEQWDQKKIKNAPPFVQGPSVLSDCVFALLIFYSHASTHACGFKGFSQKVQYLHNIDQTLCLPLLQPGEKKGGRWGVNQGRRHVIDWARNND